MKKVGEIDYAAACIVTVKRISGYNQRDVEKFLELDVPAQLKSIEHMKATIVELEKYKKQLGSLMK